MASLFISRLCFRNAKTLRQIYTFKSVGAVPRVIFSQNVRCLSSLSKFPTQTLQPRECYPIIRHYSDAKPEKPSLIQRFKEMYRSYWYVLVPVHFITSAAWFGSFYYLAKSGVDIAGILESWNVSEKITNTLKDSSMGYLAVAYAMYKIATPVRYTVTLAGTTVSINYLRKWGYIKPVPTTTKLKVMYKEQKENFIESFKETKGFYKEKKDTLLRDTKIELKLHKDQLKDQKDSLVSDIEKSLKKIKKPAKACDGKD